MRSRTLWTIAAPLAVLAVAMFAWSAHEAAIGKMESKACFARGGAWILTGLGCMNFRGLEQAMLGIVLVALAAVPAGVASWRLWSARRDRDELAVVEQELARLNRRGS